MAGLVATIEEIICPPEESWAWAGKLDRVAQREATHRQGIRYLGFHVAKALVGYASFYPDARKQTRVGVIAVDPTQRRRGVFKQLLNGIIGVAKARGDLELVVVADNAKLRAYLASIGFATVDKRTYYLFL
jgi:N-acetylglutamate synthase-like GNAT family acetyltransferase